jgi:hypothetical protein
MARLPVLCLPKICAINYRVVLGEKPDYDARPSSSTSRPSASSPLRRSTAASRRFKSGDLDNLHLDRTALGPVFHEEEKENTPLSSKNSMEKQRMKNEKKKSHHNTGNKSNHGQHAHNRSKHAHKSAPKKSVTASAETEDFSASGLNECSVASSSTSKNSNKIAVCDKVNRTILNVSLCADILQTRPLSPLPASQSQPMLMPKGQTGHTTRSISSRTKLPRLHGADLYVARLGWKVQGSANHSVACCTDAKDITDEELLPRPSTGSLHEELLNSRVKTTSWQMTATSAEEKEPSVLSSQPCYRCISYMSSVGIKRVFWTTGSGTWESAKVRDLVDALDNVALEQLSEAAATLSNIFVTKHEVLILRRTMSDR